MGTPNFRTHISTHQFYVSISLFQKVRKPLEIIFMGNGSDEALHVKVDVNENVVWRWSFYDNATQEPMGAPGLIFNP